MSVSFGCLLRSTLSLISLGSNAILCPLAELSYDVSGDRSSLRFGTGEETLLPSSLSAELEAAAAPLRRVRPEDDSMENLGVQASGVAW